MTDSTIPLPASVLHRKVKVTTCDDHVFEGFVFTVDPESGNYVLLRDKVADLSSLYIICGWSIKEVEILEQEPHEDVFIALASKLSKRLKSSGGKDTSSSDAIATRKTKLQTLFETNRIELLELDDGRFTVNNVVFIDPPYTFDSCHGQNVFVLDRIRKLVMTLDG